MKGILFFKKMSRSQVKIPELRVLYALSIILSEQLVEVVQFTPMYVRIRYPKSLELKIYGFVTDSKEIADIEFVHTWYMKNSPLLVSSSHRGELVEKYIHFDGIYPGAFLARSMTNAIKVRELSHKQILSKIFYDAIIISVGSFGQFQAHAMWTRTEMFMDGVDITLSLNISTRECLGTA